MSNDFLPFAVGGAANVESQSAYVADTTTLQNGFQSGVADSSKLNKVWRQSSIMAAVVAQFIVARTGASATDDGTTATLLANLQLSAAKVNGDATQTFSVAPATQSQHAVQLGQVLGKQQLFTSSGSFTVPTGVTQVFVTAVGGGAGGGGGGGNAGAGAAGGGGGGGQGKQTVKQAVTVAPGQVLTVTIGAPGNGASGGTSAPTSGGTGGAGGTTSVSGTSPTVSISLPGGSGGVGGVGASGTGITAPGVGGASGGGGGGGGCGGTPSISGGTLPGAGGPGGGTIFGGGGYAVSPLTGAGGGSGFGSGSGGAGGTGGSSSAAAGGNGGNGVAGAVLIEW